MKDDKNTLKPGQHNDLGLILIVIVMAALYLLSGYIDYYYCYMYDGTRSCDCYYYYYFSCYCDSCY